MDNFLGIGEGKRRAKIEAEKRKTAQQNANIAAQNAPIKQAEQQGNILLEQLQNAGQKTTVVAAVVIIVAVMVGIYFILKNRKK